MHNFKFLNIEIQCKGSINDCDWRAFLHYADGVNMMKYTIRGYGKSAGAAADDAMKKFAENPVMYTTDACEWV